LSGLLLVVISRLPASVAALSAALLVLLPQLFEARALRVGQDGQHFAVDGLACLSQLVSKLARPRFLFDGQSAALSLCPEQLSKLVALRLGALPDALVKRANLLPLRVGQVELAEGLSSVLAHAWAVAASHAPVLFGFLRSALRRALLLLREGRRGEGGQEDERQTDAA